MTTRAETTKIRNNHQNEANTECFRAKNDFPIRINVASVRNQGQLQGYINSTDFNMLGMQTSQLAVRRTNDKLCEMFSQLLRNCSCHLSNTDHRYIMLPSFHNGEKSWTSIIAQALCLIWGCSNLSHCNKNGRITRLCLLHVCYSLTFPALDAVVTYTSSKSRTTTTTCHDEISCLLSRYMEAFDPFPNSTLANGKTLMGETNFSGLCSHVSVTSRRSLHRS
ncbi:hypothetical protein Mapa_016171 [Marchantia paleacea]|nr:hypothetical protein Mapa_016171 [Marchantia paleacea]